MLFPNKSVRPKSRGGWGRRLFVVGGYGSSRKSNSTTIRWLLMRTTLVTESKKRQLSGSLSGDANTKSRATRVRRIWLRCAKELVSRIKTNPDAYRFLIYSKRQSRRMPPKNRQLAVCVYLSMDPHQKSHPLKYKIHIKTKITKTRAIGKKKFFCSFFLLPCTYSSWGARGYLHSEGFLVRLCEKKREPPTGQEQLHLSEFV